jgi:hypothetical protein
VRTGGSTDNDFASDPLPRTLWTLRAHAVLDVALTVPYASDAALIISACVPGPGCLEVPLPLKSILRSRGCEFAIELILGFGPIGMRRWASVFRRH